MRKLIYLDNAATSFPKPTSVVEAMVRYMNEAGANPGRAGHPLALEAQHIVETAREDLAGFFNIDEPSRIAFTLNVTEALNMVIRGYVRPGDHVVTSAMEHNSVMRPLAWLEERGDITLDIAPCDIRGALDMDALARLVRKDTRLVILNHGSNVCGTIQDVAAVRKAIGGTPLLLDAAQTAGFCPIDVQGLGIDFLAFTGHKGLMGPQGTGGLYVRRGLEVDPLVRGGTGSRSEDLRQPDFMPDALESGTRNNVGIAGLGAAVRFILEEGAENIRRHEEALTQALLSGIYDLGNVTIYGPLNAARQTPVVSVTFDSTLPGDSDRSRGCGAVNLQWFDDGMTPDEADRRFAGDHNILVRVGLHCAPMAHKTIGTFPGGTVRLSMGYFNTMEEIEKAVDVIREVAARS